MTDNNKLQGMDTDQPWPATEMRPDTDKATPVKVIQTFGFGLFSDHMSTPKMPILIHRDREFLEKYAEQYLHYAYVPWTIEALTHKSHDISSWFRK